MTDEAHKPKQTGTKLLELAIVIALCIWAYNTWFKPDTWIGIYEIPYSNVVQTAGEFEDGLDCANWKNAKMASPQSAYNIECGKNCKAPTTAMGFYQCEETF